MFEEIEGVVNAFPVPKAVPPLALANHEIVPAEAVADNETVPAPQREPPLVPLIPGIAFTVATTAVLLVEAQLLS